MGKVRSPVALAVIIVLAAGATVLGFWGFMETMPVTEGWSLREKTIEILGNVWRTFGLFLGNSPPEDAAPSFKLALARVLAIAATAGAVVEFLAEFLGDRVDMLRGLMRRGHTVIVGCGERGLLFLSDCRHDTGGKAVVVDRRDDKAIRVRARDAKALYFVGDARSEDVLKVSGLPRAKRLLIFCGDDAENLAVLATAARMPRKRTEKLEVLVGIDDPQLVRELNRDDDFVRGRAHEAMAFNIKEAAARDFLTRFPLVDEADLRSQSRIHLACVGWSAFTFAVLEQLARVSPCSLLGKPTVSLLVHDELAVRSELTALRPVLFDVLNVKTFGLDSASNVPNREQMAAVEPGANDALTAILVSTDDDAASTAAALAIRDRGRRASRWRAPIYVHTEKRGVLTDLLEDRASNAVSAQRIVPIGFTEDVCRLHTLFEQRDKLAQEIHRSYLRFKGIEAETAIADRDENEQEWPQLGQTYRIACRRAADHLPIKLLSAGMVWTTERLAASSELALGAGKEELEALAEIEHESWEIDRRFDGWQYGETRDNEARRHPEMIPYSQLTENIRDFDRDQVRVVSSSLTEASGTPSVFRECRIGLFGHNKVSAADKAAMLKKLENEVLPGVLKTHRDKFISICTPLAPGADTILTEVVLSALTQSGVPHRLIVLRTLPVRTVVNEYLKDNGDDAQWRLESSPASADTMIDYLNDIVAKAPRSFVADMMAPGISVADYDADADLRTAAYERGGAWLAERCDLLIAFFDSSRNHGRGGTRTTLQWADGSVGIPANVSTLLAGRNARKPRVYRV